MSKSLISKVPYTGKRDQQALNKEMARISKANPKNAVLAIGTFSGVTIYIYKSLASIPVDSPEARQMLSATNGLAYVNGKLSQPTSAWQARQNLANQAGCDH